MKTPYDFRQFQNELASLDNKKEATDRSTKTATASDRQATGRAEFTALRERYRWTVADVVSFFPEEEGIAYLQSLIAAAETPKRPRKRKVETPPDGTN